jgi:hypothetical protein
MSYFGVKVMTDLDPNSVMVEVDVKSQRLTAKTSKEILVDVPISTAKKGVGCVSGSFCTPSGKHHIEVMIGRGAPLGTIFKGRIPVGVWKPTGRLIGRWSVENYHFREIIFFFANRISKSIISIFFENMNFFKLK